MEFFVVGIFRVFIQQRQKASSQVFQFYSNHFRRRLFIRSKTALLWVADRGTLIIMDTIPSIKGFTEGLVRVSVE